MGSAARRFFALLMAAALLLTVQGTALSGAEDAMLSRLRAHSFVFAGIDCSDKKDTMLSTAEEMLSAGFAPAFVAGLLGNIACEGDFGRFENIFGYTESRIRTVFAAMIAAGKHVYVAHMQGLASLDGCGHDHSEYKPYSNRHIYEGFSLSAVSAMLAAYRQENWRAMFGLGTVQWSKERTVTLVEFYQSAAGGRDTITREECMAAETAMMRYELQHAYRGVYSNWMTANAAGLLTPGAASDAGDRVCLYYEGLTSESARARRSLLAELIFQAMQDGTTPEPAPTDTPLPTASMTPLPTCSAAPSPDVTATPAPTPTTVPTAPPDDAFRLNRSAYTIQLTKQRTFQLKPVFGDGQAHRVTYGTSDASIATVSGKGKITAKSVGVAVITAMAEDGRVRACRVTVKAPSASISSIKSASRRSITIKPKSGVSFSAWQVQFRRQGSAQWRTKSFTGRQGTIAGLTSGAMMEARIRVRFTGADGKKFYTAWSKEKTAAVR